MRRLIIPINVEAFISNGKTSDNKMVHVVSPDYKKVSYTSFLGSKNTPGDFQLAPPLKAGVHIHFILPDCLTHCRNEEYPAVPDRYIITRLYSDADSSKIHSKCFIVESGFISNDKKYSDSITIPMFNEKNPKTNWRYLGRCYDTENIPLKNGKEEYIKKLTAVGAGDPMFAAYYPSCSSVFGFHDNMEDVPINSSITYFVVGVYSNSDYDPFVDVKTQEDFKKKLDNMRLSVNDEMLICNGCILFGEISGVLWKGIEADYSFALEGEINVSVGNTSAEALSAAIVRSAGMSEDTERLLTAIQYGLEDSVSLSDGNYKIDDEVLLRQFQRLDAGEEKYNLVTPKNVEKSDKSEELGSIFSQLLREKCEFYKLNRWLEYIREKLFYSWEQYMLCYEDPRFTPKNIPSKAEMLEEIKRICTEEIKNIENEISKKAELVKEIESRLNKAMVNKEEAISTAAEPFYLPKDPVILLSGAGVKRSYAFGEDGRFTNDNTLRCQTCVIEANVKKSDVFGHISDITFASMLDEEYEDLLYQAVLLSADCLSIIEKNIDKVEMTGEIPSKVAVNKYHNDFIALFMAWEAEYYPVVSNIGQENPLREWKYNADEVFYNYVGNLEPSQITRMLFSGRTILTPHAVINFSEALKNWNDSHPNNPDIAEAADKIKDLGVVSQNLDGFIKAFSALKQTYQFPIVGAGGDDDIAMLVGNSISSNRTSIIPEGAVMHLKGGYFGINRISLVGTFGQIQNLSKSSYFGKKEICFSESMKSFGDNYAITPPAFTSPVRINFNFLCAGNDNIISSAAPETSPVLGIILPETLNRRLMIYESGGRYIGSVNTIYRNGRAYAAWASSEKPEQKFDDTCFDDRRLRDFVQALLTVDGALTDIMKIIDIYYDSKLIPNKSGFIWGRPLVLARCGLSFEFMGGPEFVKNITYFGKYDTLDAEKISFPIMFGDIRRVTDGVVGCYCDEYGYNGIKPTFGTMINSEGEYMLSEDKFCIASNDGEKLFTLLMEPHAFATIQTGLLPVKTVAINAVHAEAADNIFAAAEINPIITRESSIQMPVNGYAWKYNNLNEYIQNKIVPPMVDFGETIIMDGFIIKGEKNE